VSFTLKPDDCARFMAFMAECEALRKAEKNIALLRAALVGLIGADSEQELRQMEVTMRLLPAPAEDKAVSINAIHALLATLPFNALVSAG
jgi:hypothetical protein